MSKTKNDLIEKAKKLMDEVKKIEEKEALLVGKLVIKYFKTNQINDMKLYGKIDEILNKKKAKQISENKVSE